MWTEITNVASEKKSLQTTGVVTNPITSIGGSECEISRDALASSAAERFLQQISAPLSNEIIDQLKGTSVASSGQDEFDDDESDSCSIEKSTVAETTEICETRRELEDLQVQTIFSLIEDISVEVAGDVCNKKLLFLTNSQVAHS
jgi:hypothetical protein